MSYNSNQKKAIETFQNALNAMNKADEDMTNMGHPDNIIDSLLNTNQAKKFCEYKNEKRVLSEEFFVFVKDQVK